MILISILFLSASRLHPAAERKDAPKLGSIVHAISTNLRTMYQDRKGHHWFGSDSEGVSLYDGKSIVRYTTKDGLPSDQVTEIQQDKKGNLIFTTPRGISKFDGKSFTTLTAIVMDQPDKGWRLHPDDLWFAFGSRNGGPSRYDGKTLYTLRFPKHHLEDAKMAQRPVASMYSIYTIYKDRKGYLWFGTGNAGLCRYDGKTINWLYLDHLTYTPEGGSFGIRSIIEDRDGKLWVCNTRNRFTPSPSNRPVHGMLEYKATMGTGSFQSLIGKDALYFQSATLGKEGDLWMMPWRGGIFRYDGKKVTHYPVKDGNRDVLMIKIYKDRLGCLWICSQTDGPYRFTGQKFEKFSPS